MAEDDTFVREELILYISSLEDQLRKIHNESDIDHFRQSRLALFMEQQQDRYLQSKNQLVTKEFESLQSKEKLKARLRQIKQESQCIGYDYEDIVKQGLESVDEVSSKIERRLSVNKEIQDKERSLGEEILFHELAKRDAINNEVIVHVKQHPFEKVLIEKSSKFCDEMYNFSTTKQEIMNDIWNIDESSITDPEIEKMQSYFYGLEQELAKSMDKKREEIAMLKKEKALVMSKLNASQNKNAELKNQKKPKISFNRQADEDSFSHLKQQLDDELENVKLRNYELSDRLKIVEKENKDLKKQFWSAYRKIYQDASFKVFVLEEAIRLRKTESRDNV